MILNECHVLVTNCGCYNWTATSLRSYATFLVRHNIMSAGVFMATIDQVQDPSKEGQNETSPLFCEVMHDFLNGALKTHDGDDEANGAMITGAWMASR
jgi:hypothetical protein